MTVEEFCLDPMARDYKPCVYCRHFSCPTGVPECSYLKSDIALERVCAAFARAPAGKDVRDICVGYRSSRRLSSFRRSVDTIPEFLF